MDTFRLCIALGPVGIYLLVLGLINSFRRPLLVSGGRDAAALGIALSGLIFVGPGELLVPVSATVSYGPYVWMLLVPLYYLALILVVLLSRPRLTVYNLAPEELRPVLADVIVQLDPEARWAGNALFLPRLRVQLYLEGTTPMRHVSLIAAGPQQNPQSWRELEQRLREALTEVEVPRNPRAISLFSAGLLILMGLGLLVWRDPQSVAQSLANFGDAVLHALHL